MATLTETILAIPQDIIGEIVKSQEDLRPKTYFEERSAREMNEHLKSPTRTLQQTMAAACRLVAFRQEDAGLAGQISARSKRGDGIYWTLRYGLGWEEANPEDFIEVDSDLHTISGVGMANPATRFHLWIYAGRPDVQSIIHTHSPWTQALCAARQPLVVCQMDMTPFHNDCSYLGDWPGVPIADDEGVLISEALKQNRSILLAHHGMLTTGVTVQEATYLAVNLDRAARTQLRASVYGPLQSLDPVLAQGAHDYTLRPKHVNATFDYWFRQTKGIKPLCFD